jgi:YggT family protein
MLAFNNLITLLFDTYAMIVLARLWLQWSRADFYNPFSQFVVKATQPAIGPLRRVIPSLGKFDTATFVFALLVILSKFILFFVLSGSMLPVLTTLVLVLFGLLKSAFWLLFIVLIGSMILSFVPNVGPSIRYVLHQLTDPLLAPIRQFLPSLGGLDFSPLVLILAIQFALDLIGQYLPYLM